MMNEAHSNQQARVFRAANMSAALEDIQRELGPEAMVLSVRETPGSLMRRPGVEVLAAPGAPAPQQPQPMLQPSPVTRVDGKTVRSFAPPIANKPGAARPATAYQQVAQPDPSLDDDANELLGLLSRLESQLSTDGKANPALAALMPAANKPAASTPAKPAPAAEKPGLPRTGPLPASVPVSSQAAKTSLTPRDRGEAAALPIVLREIREELLDSGLDANLTEKLVTASAAALAPWVAPDRRRVRAQIAHLLEAELRTLSPDQLLRERVLCLVGASGSGKTSVAARLAASYTRQHKRKVAWVCADTLRTNAIQEARAYTDALNVPLFIAYTPEELSESVAKLNHFDLVLVDTPRCNPHRDSELVELGNLITALKTRSTLLVLPATAKDLDARQMVSGLGLYQLRGIIGTKLDETGSAASLINTAWKAHLPLTFVSTGPDILNDFQPARPSALAELILSQRIYR